MDITANPASTPANKTGGWRTFIPRTDLQKCIGCGICARVCSEGAITMVPREEDPSKQKPVTDYDYCKGCGVCATECPVKAITMEREEK